MVTCHRGCSALRLPTRVSRTWVRAQSVCRFLIHVRHQHSPFLGTADRIGEAKNLGPRLKNATCLLNIAIANPTSLVSKRQTLLDLFAQEDLQILCLAETSATANVQKACQRNMSAIRCKCFWSCPVQPQRTCADGLDSVRGRVGGTAVMSTVPMRHCRNPLPVAWQTTTRFVHTIAQFGQSHFQIITVYSIPQNHAQAKEFLNSILELAWQQALSVPLPYVICGDFNMELDPLPIWALMQQKGCQDLIHLHRQKYGREMPATCQGVTRPDNAVISPQLVPYVGQIKVLAPGWFATHTPVCFSLQLPKPDMFRCKLKLPATWIDTGLEQADLQQAFNQVPDVARHPTTLEEWGQLVETVVDHAIQSQHQKTGLGPTHLTRAYRGRCQPRKIANLPVFSSVKTARDGDFNPLYEVTTMKTRRLITQLRRLQCLQRRVAKHEKHHQSPRYCNEMCDEWNKILSSTCFGVPFYQWLMNTPECGPPPLPLPTEAWINVVTQLVKHEVNQLVAADHTVFARKAKFAAMCDRKHRGSAGAFRAIKDTPKLPITEVRSPHSQFVTMEWDTATATAVCSCDDPQLLSLDFPVKFQDTIAWIIGRDEYSITVRCHDPPEELPSQTLLHQDQVHVNPKLVADQLSNYWLPLWQKPHDIDTQQAWPAFEELMQHLPHPPREFQPDDSLAAWMDAVRSLKSKSARGFDAISAQELRVLPPALIDLLKDVCNNYSQGFPAWLIKARVCPLSKVDGTPLASQSRPICILSQVYRLHASVWCRQALRYWATWFPPEICGMLPHRGSHSSAYGVQAALETACYQQQSYSGVTLDLIKCFNCIRHQVGWRLLVRLGLPHHRVFQWYSSISKLQRFWEISGESFGPVGATCGFPEGDSHSVLVMVGIAMLWIYNLKRLHRPMLMASSYADNWTWKTGCALDHAPAAQVTIAVTAICGLDIDWSKTWLWASDTPTADAMRQVLADHVPVDVLQRLHSARDLGFEVQYSGGHRVGHRAQRYEAALRRLDRMMGTGHLPGCLLWV